MKCFSFFYFKSQCRWFCSLDIFMFLCLLLLFCWFSLLLCLCSQSGISTQFWIHIEACIDIVCCGYFLYTSIYCMYTYFHLAYLYAHNSPRFMFYHYLFSSVVFVFSFISIAVLIDLGHVCRYIGSNLKPESVFVCVYFSILS